MKRALMNTTLAALTFCGALAILDGCTTDTTDSTNSVNTINGGSGGSSAGSAGTGGTTAGAGGTTAGAGGSTAGAGGSTAGTGGSTAGAGGSTAGTGGTGGTTAGSGGAGAGGVGGSAPTSRIRFAHLAPDVGEIDLCFRPSGSADWTEKNAYGPFFKSSGATDSFYFPGVSIYTDITEGQWDFRFVAKDAADCQTAFSDSFADQTGQIGANKSYTLALEGDLAAQLKFAIYPDQTPAAGKVGYQVINALTQTGNIDFGLTDVSDPNNQLFNAVVTNVLALGADSQGNADASPNAIPTAIKAGTTPAVPVGISPAIVSVAGDQYAVFVAGTKLDDATAGLRPQLIFCRNDNTNGIDDANLKAGKLIATKSCCYGDGMQDCNTQ